MTLNSIKVSSAVAFASGCCWASVVLAGMPSPELVLTELGKRRFEEISFFLAGFLLLTGVVRWLWNGLSKEIPALPNLSYRGMLGLMLLWGLALTVVLSLISGARELMTPAAWEPNGVTHRVAGTTSTTVIQEDLSQRTERLSVLKTALWDYAQHHDGQFPTKIEELPETVPLADQRSEMPYFLTPGLSKSSVASVLVREPDIFPRRLFLMTDGTVVVEESSFRKMP